MDNHQITQVNDNSAMMRGGSQGKWMTWLLGNQDPRQ
jgi:hypothetical protein